MAKILDFKMYEKLYQAVYAEMNMMKKSYNPNKNTTL